MKKIKFSKKHYLSWVLLPYFCMAGLHCSAAENDENTSVTESTDEESYPWKGIIQHEATSGVVTLSDLQLNKSGRVIMVKPGERIEGEVLCTFNRKECSKFAFYRIIIGINGIGPQTSVYNGFCLLKEKSSESFSFSAPEKDGVYQIRFRLVDAFSENTAFEKWKDAQGEDPGAGTTIGVIIVKS
jgi:hypothetical protein